MKTMIKRAAILPDFPSAEAEEEEEELVRVDRLVHLLLPLLRKFLSLPDIDPKVAVEEEEEVISLRGS